MVSLRCFVYEEGRRGDGDLVRARERLKYWLNIIKWGGCCAKGNAKRMLQTVSVLPGASSGEVISERSLTRAKKEHWRPLFMALAKRR